MHTRRCQLTDTTSGQVTLYKSTGVAVDSKVYLFGGTDKNQVCIFDTEKNEYSFVKDIFPANPYIHGEICYAAADAINAKIYLFGGDGNNGSSAYAYDAVSVFDTQTLSLEVLDAKLPKSLNNLKAVAHGNRVYLFGGYTSNNYTRVIVFTTGALLHNTLYIKTTDAKMPVLLYVSDKIAFSAGVEAVYLGNENDEAIQTDAYLYDFTAKAWKLIT